MRINRLNDTNTNFKGIHIANARNIINNLETDIKLYEMTAKNDKSFIKILPQKVQMDKLMPDLSAKEYARWHEILQYGCDNALFADRKSLLAVVNNKPCGLAVFQPGKNKFHLDCICTWPVEYGKKVPLAGTTLFKQLFTIFQNAKSSRITLEAIIDGPYDTVSKYKKLGFMECGGEGHEIFMETNAAKVKQTLKRLDSIIDTEEIIDSKNEKLNEIFDL